MPITIDDSHFSIWDLVRRVETRSALVNHRRTMNIISHEIEDVTISGHESGHIFAGFQYLSRFLPQEKRYRKMAEYADAIYVFGVPDVDVPDIPNLHYVHLSPGDTLTREWFIVSYGPNYASALATHEPKTSIYDPDELRMFKGLWTFDKDVVAVLYQWLVNVLDLRDVVLSDNPDYDHQRQVMAVNREIKRLEWMLQRTGDLNVSSEIKAITNTLQVESIKLMAATV